MYVCMYVSTHFLLRSLQLDFLQLESSLTEDAPLSQSVWNQYKVSSVSVGPTPGIPTYGYLLVCLLDKVYTGSNVCLLL